MGRLSDQRHSARRPGKRERARVKKPRRGQFCGWNVLGAGTVLRFQGGRKHEQRFYRWLASHQLGNLSRKPGEP